MNALLGWNSLVCRELTIVDLQCVSFKCIVKQLSYTYTYIYYFSDSFSYRLVQNIEKASCAI